MTDINTNDIARDLFGVANFDALTAQQQRWISAALADAKRMINQFLRKSVEITSRTEILKAGEPENRPGLIDYESMTTQRDTLYLTHTPVASSTLQLWENCRAQVFTDTHLLTAGTEFQIEDVIDGYSKTGVLRRLSGTWPTAPGAVKVTYAGGPTEFTNRDFYEAVNLATQETVMDLYERRKRFSLVGVSSGTGELFEENIGEYRRVYATGRNSSDADQQSRIAGVLPDTAIVYLEPYLSIGSFL
jgi:hypothetical protein